MTKPREKIRKEVPAEIEDGEKKIRQLKNRAKVLRQKLAQEERKAHLYTLTDVCAWAHTGDPTLILRQLALIFYKFYICYTGGGTHWFYVKKEYKLNATNFLYFQ